MEALKHDGQNKASHTAPAAKGFAGARDMDLSALSDGGMTLNLDDDRIPAYMINNNHELVWFNEAARRMVFGFASLHPSSEMRNIFLLLGSVPQGMDRALITLHAGLAKSDLTQVRLAHALRLADDDRADAILDLFREAPELDAQGTVATPYCRSGPDGDENWQVVSIFFREGTFCAHVPAHNAEDVRAGLKNRSQIIRQLANRQAPLLTPMGVMVADLQNSVKICAELLPQDYFRLINQIWQTIGPIVRKHHGQIAKHAGDGMVAYFFPHSDGHYLADAAACALEIKQEMRRFSKEWQIERQWAHDLYMNIGLHEGQEWLGAIQLGESIEFSALGDTINIAARLCDVASLGGIWASKALITRLQSESDTPLEFGVDRVIEGARRQFVPQSFVQVSSLMEGLPAGKWQDLGTMAVTEVVGLGPRAR